MNGIWPIDFVGWVAFVLLWGVVIFAGTKWIASWIGNCRRDARISDRNWKILERSRVEHEYEKAVEWLDAQNLAAFHGTDDGAQKRQP